MSLLNSCKPNVSTSPCSLGSTCECCETTFLRFSLSSDVFSFSAEHSDLLAACPSRDEHQHRPRLFWWCWMCSVLQHHLPTSAELCVEFISVWDYQATLLDGIISSSFLVCFKWTAAFLFALCRKSSNSLSWSWMAGQWRSNPPFTCMFSLWCIPSLRPSVQR